MIIVIFTYSNAQNSVHTKLSSQNKPKHCGCGDYEPNAYVIMKTQLGGPHNSAEGGKVVVILWLKFDK